ncbi:MAG: hypothetical protein AAF658_18200, partial [Myxococcota bacterium]
SSLDRMTPGQALRIVSEERAEGDEVWVNAKLKGVRFLDLTLGFLMTAKRRVVDVRMGPLRLTHHFRESIGRSIQNLGLDETLRRLEAKAAAAARGLGV